MKKIIRICLCLAMLFVAIGAHAQTAADGIYSKGMALKKQRTKTSLTQAIANFRKAKGLYATEAGKDKCDAQIGACNYLLKRINKPKPKPKPITKNDAQKTVVEEVAQVDKHKNVEISLSEDYLDFKSRMEGGAQSVTVTCNYDDWYIEDQPKWVKASKAGNDKIYVEVEDNLGKEKRSGVVSIKCGDVDVDLVINQKKADITRKVKEGAVKVWKSLFGGKKDK
ncbi:hypothetical protein ST45_04695 [Prevotella pectinovora]|uniref:BACON domain-containing protein n=1 Tax=Prevotella pectinovora TaxID=1602169 RepID=UPI0005B6BA02|nr:BACON domain-containing protein [Prevotella pectinovora]KIP62904.1 hypothetical protein ST45_04695 [Prevotella pectinovora]